MFSNWGYWWKSVDKKDETPAEPDTCDLCGKTIKKDDYYYLGLTHYAESLKVWAFTCTDSECVRWLISKGRRTKQK